MATVLRIVLLKDRVLFCFLLLVREHNAKDINEETFPAYGVKCLPRKAFTTGPRNSLKDVRT
jgi:hypothetical protein